MRRAVTLVEILFAAVAASVLLGGVYAVWFSSDASQRKTEARDEAAQAALVAAEAIESRLRDLVTLYPQQEPPCTVGEEGRVLSFYTAGPELRRDRNGCLVATPATVRAVPLPGGGFQLVINGEMVRGVRLARLAFRAFEPKDAPEPAYFVEFELVATDSWGVAELPVRRAVRLRYPTERLARPHARPPGGGYQVAGP